MIAQPQNCFVFHLQSPIFTTYKNQAYYDMNQFDVRIDLPSGLLRSFLDFLLSFNYALRVSIPFKVIAKASRTSGILKCK